MLGVIMKRIESPSSRCAAALLICVARAALGSSRGYRSGGGGGGATSYACSLPELIDRGVTVSVLDFEIPASEAVRRFEDYQRKSCMYLHAHNLLGRQPQTIEPVSQSGGPGAPGAEPSGANSSSNTHTMTAAYLPYWCFEATFNSEAYAKLGFKDSRTGEMVWRDKADPLQLSTGAVASLDDPAMQVYASYKYVRDVGSGAGGRGLPRRCRAMTHAEAKAGSVGGVALHPADMRQGLAWQLAVRALTHKQLQAAEGALREATGSTDLRDVRVVLQVLTRHCRLVFLPAYIAVYQYGSRYKQGTSGVIVPQVFTAAVGGTEEGRVVAPEHLCPTKASLSAGGLMWGLGLLSGDATWATPLGGLETVLPQLGSVEALTLAALAASGAGLWAHQRPQKLRTHHAAKQVRADFEFYKKYDIHETYGSGAAAAAAGTAAADAQRADGAGGNEEYMLWLWADADWRRWEQDEPWNWDEGERRIWAEELWRKQATRRLQRQRYVERLAAQAQRRAAEEAAEARRERLYGGGARTTSYHSHRPQDHGMGGAEGGGSLEASGRRWRRSDFLGYYRVLGLQDAEAVSTDDIKQAFKVQALLLHPDKHVGADVEVQRDALVKFQKLQIAYDTLKDAEKRLLYDRGQLVQ
ncbi:hypothetical protein VaNZ11_000818 [Volvox africanus]|uniref:J domain-containing protein n=1 Tax=Volvox africanus TaxID=51714 RepID=A0ABQ5RN59_9CHLO|nr:hypothetical protein VaNZ11_000818 [Volvox africanus]